MNIQLLLGGIGLVALVVMGLLLTNANSQIRLKDAENLQLEQQVANKDAALSYLQSEFQKYVIRQEQLDLVERNADTKHIERVQAQTPLRSIADQLMEHTK